MRSLLCGAMRLVLLASLLPRAASASAIGIGRRRPQEPPPSAPPTEGTWRSAVDPASGRTYYWNTATRESRWTKPTTPVEAAVPPVPSAVATSPEPAAAEPESETEEEYTPGEADMEEYTINNPSRPMRLRPLPWVRARIASSTTAARTAISSISTSTSSIISSSSGSSSSSSTDETRRSSFVQGVYLGSLFLAAAALL